MGSNPTSPSHVLPERFARLKALQRPANTPKVTRELEYDKEYSQEESAANASIGPLAAERLTALLGATIKQNRYGEHLSLHCWDAEHAPRTPELSALSLLLPEVPEEAQDPERWLFLDTETTGLSGGTGTYPFLVGLAWWERGGLEIEQLFMREFDEERSLLAALAERLEEHTILVTFNGKSFDWPLLETRYRMTRAIQTPKLKAHLDFLHPARNLWKLRLGSVRLSQLERHVLGWDRGEDMPSEDIPRIYLDFVRGGPADPLVPIFLHNQMDLRGLAGLANHVLGLLDENGSTSEDGLELFGLSRICERRGQTERARKIYEQSIGSELPRETARVARASLARLAKRDGDMARACELWTSMLGNSREGYDAYEQLAMYYEHKACDLKSAMSTTREALTQLRRARQLGLIGPGLYESAKAKFEHRAARLEHKLGGTLLGLL